MMNERVLKVLKNPELLVIEDLEILENEIIKKPYMQSIKALQLLATHRYATDLYSKELSRTAAYTTDKKILYQLINGKKEADFQFDSFATIDEKEETSLAKDFEIIDKKDDYLSESDEISQTIIPENSTLNSLEPQEIQTTENTDGKELEPQSKAALVESDPENSSDISFASVDAFLPNIKLSPKASTEKFIITTPKMNRHEEEMKRLIEEVERKLKEKKQNSTLANDKSENFLPAENEIITPEKPHREILTTETSIKSDDETPVMNVSFFSENIKSLETQPIEEKSEEIQNEIIEKSNVPIFINTWQNWLKIDRTEKTTKVSENKILLEKTDIKEKAIEEFIRIEPKISQLKTESSFTVKEKKGDITHLMTETLAKLYTEQKLYSKAIKAYEVLISKHPDKKEHFLMKIENVKELRNNQH